MTTSFWTGDNNRIFVYEEGNWSVKGRFKTALEEDEPIVWGKEGGEYSIFVALVKVSLVLLRMLLKLFRRMKVCPE